MEANCRCKTVFTKYIIAPEIATSLYNNLKNTITWVDGVKSKNGYTRKAKALNIGDNAEIDTIIAQTLCCITDTDYIVFGIYLNYYENGEMWTPRHKHQDTHQLVISLGAPRTLEIGKKKYLMEHGDAIIFGSSTHGVPKDNTINGRISIATFMKPRNLLPKLLVAHGSNDEEVIRHIQESLYF